MEKNLKRKVNAVMRIVSKHRKIKDRIAHLEKKGYIVINCPMGVGGVGQVKEYVDEYRVQISAGKGLHNYAYAVCLSKWFVRCTLPND